MKRTTAGKASGGNGSTKWLFWYTSGGYCEIYHLVNNAGNHGGYGVPHPLAPPRGTEFLDYNAEYVSRHGNVSLRLGFSVRCIRDAE